MNSFNSETANNKDVSVIICTKDCEETIEEVLLSVKKNNPLEIILVDANSNDRTREIAEKYVNEILTDPGKGLALARNIGLQKIKGNYVFFAGSDNVISSNTIKQLKLYQNNHNYVGTALLTRLKHRNKNYLTHGSDMRWRVRFYEEQREVISTPYLYRSDILKKYQFDPNLTDSDDSDLAFRLAQDGYKVGYSNIICWEIGFESLKSLISRSKRYGRSDSEYYHKYSPKWKLKRKYQSIIHPLRVELIEPLKSIKGFKKLYYVPFFLLLTGLRYKYYILNAIQKDHR